jgi:hypothetical protein
MTRAAHETLVRRMVLRYCPSVQFLSGTVTGVNRAFEDAEKLGSVTYRLSQDSTMKTMPADLVIGRLQRSLAERIGLTLGADCTGTTHAGLGWLKRAGFALEKETVVDSYHPHMRYTSSEFQVSSDALNKILPAGHDRAQPALIFLAPRPGLETRYLCILRSEGDRITTLTGGSAWNDKADSVAFLREYTRSLQQAAPVPQWVYDLFDYMEDNSSDTATYTDCNTSK